MSLKRIVLSDVLGVIGFDLSSTSSRWHAGEAWWAPLSIQAQIHANYNPVAEAEAVLAEAPALV